MTLRTLRWRFPVLNNLPAVHPQGSRVTEHASHAFVRPVQEKSRLGMIKAGWRQPRQSRMTRRAGSAVPSARKLAAMDVFMTPRTLLACALETDQFSGSCSFCLVAGDAANGPVGANEKKTRPAVVKSQRRRPGINAVAGFALVLLRAQFVRVAVTGNTASVLEHILMGFSSLALPVTVRTCRSLMRANEIEPCLPVAGKSKCRGNERVCVVTVLTPIRIPRHKLKFVSVLMTIRARLEFWMVVHRGSGLLVAVGAGSHGMLSG